MYSPTTFRVNNGRPATEKTNYDIVEFPAIEELLS